METVETLKGAVKHWYLTLILGIAFIGLGFWVFQTPLQSYIALAMLFSFAFLFTGGLEIKFAIFNRQHIGNWGWLLTVGIVDIVVGTYLVTHPLVSVELLPYFVAFVILFRSLSGVGWAFELKKKEVIDWSYILIVSVIGMFFALILLWKPLLAGMSVVYYTAMAFMFLGAFYIYLSFRLRKISKKE